MTIKKTFLLLLFIPFYLNGFAQLKTIYYDEDDHSIEDSTQAASYAIYGKVSGDSLYTFKKYDADGYVTVTGSFRDEELTVPQGKFVYYDWVDELSTLGNSLPAPEGKERYIVIRGNYLNGKRNGPWISFYPDGKVKTVITFSNDVMDGEYKYFDVKGNLQISGTYKDNKKEGLWISSGGRKLEQYQAGKLISVIKKSKKQLKEEAEKGNK